MIKHPRLVFKTVEGRLLYYSCGILAIEMIFFVITSFLDFKYGQHLLTVFISNVFVGRAAGILLCLRQGDSIFFSIFYNFLVELQAVCVFYPVMVFIIRDVIEFKILRKAIRQAEKSMQTHRTLLKRFGIPGLFLFVVLPFQMTGPLIGCVVGYLLNYSIGLTFTIVGLGTLTATSIYVLLGSQAIEKLQAYAPSPWWIIGIITLLLVLQIKNYKQWFDAVERENTDA